MISTSSKRAVSLSGACALLVACGARTDLSFVGEGGASSATVATATQAVGATSVSTTAGVGGSVPVCDPPVDGEVVTQGLGKPVDLVVADHIAYVLTASEAIAVPLCGGTPRTVLTAPSGASNVRRLSLVGNRLRWAFDLAGGPALVDVGIDGLGASTEPVVAKRLIGAAADANGTYWARDDGSLTAQQNTPLAGVVGPLSAWAPPFVDQGWVYFGFSTSSPALGQMIRARTDGQVVSGVDPPTIPVPTDFVVDGQEIFLVDEKASELRRIQINGPPVVQSLAILSAPRSITLDATYLYVADDKGIERAHRDGSLVELLWPLPNAAVVAEGVDAVVWLDADGRVSWRRKPK